MPRRKSRSRSDASDHSRDKRSTRSTKRERSESEASAKHAEDEKRTPTKKDQKEIVNSNDMKVEDDKEENPSASLVKPSPSMDVVVHRVRCLNFLPKPITVMKSTPAWFRSSLLALSRENGYIELKSVDEKLRTLATVPGLREHPFTSLAWIKNSTLATEMPLLVGASQDGSICHINFSMQSLVCSTASGGGGVFALESLSGFSGCDRMVAAGCEDGSIRIFEFVDNKHFVMVSSIPSSGASILSLASKRNQTAGKGLDDLTIFAAVADGTIRRFDCSSTHGKLVWKSPRRMTVENRGRNTPTRVWSLKVLQDGTLVSADSLGQVQFWNGETATLEQTIEQSDTMADVLDLAVSTDEQKVFASGIDSRVVCIQRQVGAEHSAWILSNAQRQHTHDVKSLEICRKTTIQRNSEGEPVIVDILVTGGVDTKLCTYNVGQYYKARPRVIYPWPTMTPVFVAPEARLAGIMREDKVDLYKLCEKQEVSDPILVPEDHRLVSTIEVRQDANLSCAAMSSNGRYLAIASPSSFYLFSLTFNAAGKTKKESMPIAKAVKSTVSALLFVDNTTLILSCVDGLALILQLDKDPEDAESIEKITTLDYDAPAKYDFPVHSIRTSPSGNFIATLRNSLEGGSIEIYSRDVEGSTRRHWTLPKLETSIVDFAFVDGNRLAVACLDFALVVFDTKEQRLSKWSEKVGFPVPLPAELKNRRDHPVRLLVHAGNSNKIIMGSFGGFAVFDLEKPFPTLCKCFPEIHVRGRKRKRSVSVSENVNKLETQESTATLCLRYNSMLYLGFLNESEMVVVEEPWLNIVGNFPTGLARRIYGT